MLSPGVVLNSRYQLTQRIAAGGMGEVWRGDDLLLHREIAVKVLLPALMSDADFITRFRSEARMMAALRHPGIVQVYDYGENAQVGAYQLDYLVMEYIDGTPLSKRIQQAGRLGPAETMTIVGQVADALQAAHEAGIIHRDVKPSNLLVRPAGAIVLVDFGVARSAGITGITSTNVVLGSAHYMAPEQAEGQAVTAATDVYALGAVAFSCLTGRPPYVGDNPLAVLAQLVHGPPPVLPPDVPAAVASVVLRALAKIPGQRFPSASALAAAARETSQPSPYGVSAPGSHQPNPAAPGPAGTPASGSPAPAAPGAPNVAAPGAPFPPASGSVGAASGSAGLAPAGPVGAGPGSHDLAAPPAMTGSGAHGSTPGSGPAGTGSNGFGSGSAPAGTGGHGFTPGSAPAGAAAHGFATGSAAVGASTHGSAPAAAAAHGVAPGNPARELTSSKPDKRRNVTVALAAAAVVALLAGIAVLLQNPDNPGAGPLVAASQGDQLQAGSGQTTGQRSQASPRPGGQKPPARGNSGSPAKPTGPAGGAATTDPAGGTAKPSGAATTDPATSTTTTPPTVTNPHNDPVALCGNGYSVINSRALKTSAGVLRGTIYVLYRAAGGTNCVVTIKATVDEKTSMSATLKVQGDANTYADKGTFQYYAGPVSAAAPKTCIKWGGTIGGMSYESGWSHCK